MLLIDIGGGSTSVSLIRHGRLAHTVDEHFGSIKVFEHFRSLKDSTDFAVAIDHYAIGGARQLLGRVPKGQVKHLVVTGGEVRRLVSLLLPAVAGGLLEEIDPATVAINQWVRADAGPQRPASAPRPAAATPPAPRGCCPPPRSSAISRTSRELERVVVPCS